MSKIITSSELAKSAAHNWKEQYFDGKNWFQLFAGNSEKIYQKLIAAKSDPDKIEKITGGSGWAYPWCGECKEYKRVVISFGDPEDYTKEVCLDCAEKWLKKAKKAAQ